MNQESGLPAGWTFVTIPDIVEDSENSIKRGPFGSSIKKEYFVPSGYKVYQQKNVIRNDFQWGDYFIDEEKFSELKDFELRSGDVIITCSGTIGKIAIVPKDIKRGVINQALLKISLENRIVRSEYFCYLFQSKVHEILASATRGSTMKNISSVRRLKKILFPLPPFREQKRIVDKIEELFTKIDAGVKSLQNVKAQLQFYRQAVLNHAFNGKLTDEWRKTHKNTIQPATEQLEQIRQQQKQEQGRKKHTEPSPIDTSKLPELPENWVWSSIGQLYDVVGGGTPSTKNPKYWNGDIPWITSADIHGVKDIRPRKTVTTEGIRESATNLVPEGSLIVVTRVGLGKVAITQTPLCFSQDSQALIGNNNLLNPEYSLHYLSKAVQIFKYKHRGTTIAGVTKKQLRNLPFPFPPLSEQNRIVEEIETRFSLVSEMEKVNVQSLLQSKKLRRSILKTAFEGRLVAQDPTDEPAGVLLERIKQEKIRQSNQKKGTRLRRKTGKRSQRRLDGYVE